VPGNCAGPVGIPKDWIEKTSKKSGGREWVNPKNPHDRVRAMPPDPKNDWPEKRVPNVTDQNNGSYRDVNGNPIPVHAASYAGRRMFRGIDISFRRP